MKQPDLLFSVVICTYNRAALLRMVLESLIVQQLDHSRFEVLVVDNNSTDETRAVSEEFISRAPHVRYVLERRQGLSYARNRGYEEARGCYIAYSDDDNQLPPDWLHTAVTIVEREGAGVFGGPSRAFFITPRPRWFSPTYAVFSPSWSAGDLQPSQFLCGNNIFIRKTLLEAIGGFDPQMGMQGDKLGYGEETELIARIRDRLPHERIFYDPALWVYHLVRPNKMRLRWRIYQQFAVGQYSYQVFKLANRQGRLALIALGLLRALVLVGELIYAFTLRNRQRYPAAQNYLYERVSRHSMAYGIAYARFCANQTWL